jgi:hypothetical protein
MNHRTIWLPPQYQLCVLISVVKKPHHGHGHVSAGLIRDLLNRLHHSARGWTGYTFLDLRPSFCKGTQYLQNAARVDWVKTGF